MSTTESASPAPAPEPTQEPAPKKSSIGKRILTYIVGLIVVGGAFYAFNYGNTATMSFAAGLPVVHLERAARLRGWRPKSLSLLRCVLMARKA